MPKKGRNMYERKDGRWEGRFLKGRDTKGKIMYGYVYGKSRAEVSQRLAALNAAPIPAAPQGGTVTFAEAAARWLSIAALKIKPSTLAGYTATLQLHIFPLIGERDMHSLSAADISLFAKRKLEKGRVDGGGCLSVKTVCDMLSIIKAVMGFACQARIISAEFAITYPKQRFQAMRVLSRQEQKSLEAVLTRDINIHKLGILLCLYTGLRIGEVCALRWQDISPEFDALTVRQTLQRVKNLGKDGGKTKILIDAPKSPRSVREIPIPTFLTPYLRHFAQESRSYFLRKASAAFTEPRTMQNHFAKSVSAAQITAANYHSLRHTFATRCIEAGVDIKSLSEMLGHASVNITLNRYVHSSFDQKRKGMNKLEQYIGR